MRLASRVAALSAGVGLLGALTASVLTTACFPDPEGDYEDFIARTANLQEDSGPPAEVDANIDTKPPTESVDALYVGICVTTLAAKDPEQALRFYTETKFTPDQAGGGMLALTVSPLRGWDLATNGYTSPATVSKSEIRGDNIPVPETPVAAGTGRFTAVLGTVRLTKEANSVSGKDALINNVTLDGRIGAGDRFCTTLAGDLVEPYGFTFDPKANTCLFQKVNEGDPLPKIPSAEFVCPL